MAPCHRPSPRENVYRAGEVSEKVEYLAELDGHDGPARLLLVAVGLLVVAPLRRLGRLCNGQSGIQMQ